MTEDRIAALSKQLLDTATHEFEVFIRSMKAQTPEYIIDHAYELSVKQDMVMLLEENQFSDRELETLATLEHPLDAVYNHWLRQDDSSMEELSDAFDDYAKRNLHNQAERLYADPKTPRYAGEYGDACEKEELHLYRASRGRDKACMDAFNKGVGEANANQTMRPFIQKWTEEYGHDRCKFILGYSVQRADWDKRYSPKARQDAAQYDYHITQDRDPYSELCTDAHPCLVNYAYELLMEQERGKQKPAPQENERER